ncbi:TniQ family protein [Halopseudomonas sabulinigri]|uniref:TniQ family protein n=1 Tax=Halopseudomonas sabulinigri TaxID=472181 RepID=A0ABP9ZS75_9GAMM
MAFFQKVDPQLGESLNSVMMRKAELNGYNSAHALLHEAGMTMKVAYSMDETEQLKACFELDESAMSSYLSSQPQYRGEQAFLRKVLSPVCTACLVESNVAHQAWSHLLVTACPLHEIALLSECPQCTSAIGLNRPALSRCECGFDFRRATRKRASQFAVGISALIADVPSDSRAALPAELNQLGYEPLLPSFLVMLGRHQGRLSGAFRSRARVSSTLSFEDSAALVEGLDALLGVWPARFDETLTHQLCNGKGAGLPMRVGVWFRQLFTTYSGCNFDFVRDRFKGLVAEHFDGRLGMSARAMIFGANNPEALKWFSASEAARLLGVAPDILANLVIKGDVQGRVHREGNSRFVAVHRSTLDQLTHERACYLSATEARRRLAVSKMFFDRFIQAGGLRRYKQGERPVLVAGEFKVEEIEDVIASLAKRVRKKPRVTQPIGIQDVSAKHGISNSKIISVLQDILRGTLCPIAHVQSVPGLAGFQFDKAEIDQRVRNDDPDTPLSVKHLAQVSGWKASVIKKWIQGGHLVAIKEQHGKSQRDAVRLSALIDFLLTYTPTADLSKQLGTKTNYLLQSLRPGNVSCIVPPQEAGGTHRGLLLRTTDLVKASQRRPTLGDVAERWRQSCEAAPEEPLHPDRVIRSGDWGKNRSREPNNEQSLPQPQFGLKAANGDAEERFRAWELLPYAANS